MNDTNAPSLIRAIIIFLIVITLSGCTKSDTYIDKLVSISSISGVSESKLTKISAADELKIKTDEVIEELLQEGKDVGGVRSARDELARSSLVSFEKDRVKILEDPSVSLILERPDPEHDYVSEELAGNNWRYVIHRKQGAGVSMEEIKALHKRRGGVGHPFLSLFSDEFGGVFFEEKFLIITRRTKDGSEYVYIDPHTGSEVAKTPKSKYLVGGYFNASKSAIYGVQTSSLTDKKDIGVYRILIEKGKIERVFTVPVNKYMQRQGFNVRPRVEFTQGRYLVLSIENAGRGVGFGGFIVADLLHNRIMYYEFYPDYVRYSFYASDNGNLVFSRSHSGKTENDIYRVELPTGG